MKTRFVWVLSTRNVESPGQTWIRCECLYSNGHNGLSYPSVLKAVALSEA